MLAMKDGVKERITVKKIINKNKNVYKDRT
jgi:hypothetical protein